LRLDGQECPSYFLAHNSGLVPPPAALAERGIRAVLVAATVIGTQRGHRDRVADDCHHNSTRLTNAALAERGGYYCEAATTARRLLLRGGCRARFRD